jgi:hypothetical protein
MITSVFNERIVCEALFASDLQPSQHPSAEQIGAAVRRTSAMLGVQGCAAQMAREFGDHPDTAVARMRWVRATVSRLAPADWVLRRPAVAGPLRPGAAAGCGSARRKAGAGLGD